MDRYLVNANAQPNGDHEVHKEGCRTGPSPNNAIWLGSFPSCREAVVEARQTYPMADGCANCCPDCHTT